MFSARRKAEEDGPSGKAAKLGGSDGDRNATFARNLAALNTQFAAWVAEQAAAAPKELWTDGVEDYLKYAKQLLSDYKNVLESGKPEAAAGKPPLAPAGGLFGSGVSAAVPPASIFGGLAPAGGAGAGSAAGGAGSVGGFVGFRGFCSGAASAANSGGGGLFTVPSTGTLGSSFTTGGGATEDDEGDEEQHDTEPSLQFEAGEGTELLAKHRVKLMSMTTEKKWADKGAGTLTLRRATGEEAAGKRPYFVFTTDSGRVLINAPLVKGMKPTANPKVPAAVIMFLISSVDGKEERAMHMFKCMEGADVAKQLIAQINGLA